MNVELVSRGNENRTTSYLTSNCQPNVQMALNSLNASVIEEYQDGNEVKGYLQVQGILWMEEGNEDQEYHRLGLHEANLSAVAYFTGTVIFFVIRRALKFYQKFCVRLP